MSDDETTAVDEPTDDAPEQAEQGDKPDRRRRLVLLAAALLLVAALAVVAWVRASGDEAGTAGPDGVTLTPAGSLTEPVRLPERGAFIDSVVQPDGSLAVTQWVRGASALEQVQVRAPRSSQVRGDPEVTDLEIRTSQGEVTLDDTTVGTEARTLDLVRPTLLLRLTYTLSGVTSEPTGPTGRALVGAVALDIEFPGEEGRARVQVGGRRILSLACTPADGGLLAQRSCGAPREGGWSVNLIGKEIDDLVSAQVDLELRPEANPDRASGSGG